MRMFHCLNVYFIFSANTYTRAHTCRTHWTMQSIRKSTFPVYYLHYLVPMLLKCVAQLVFCSPLSLPFSGSLIYFDSLCVLSDNVRLTCTPIHIFPFTPCTEEHMFDESIHLFTQKRINCYTLFHAFDEDRRCKWCGILQQTHGQTMIWMLVNRKHRTTYELFTVCSSTKISHSHSLTLIGTIAFKTSNH